ncbi:MAG: hypothetical protein N3F07_01655 [Candidatus Micrarchaeota archaeon]|nr:hypothetical protein [Candidatus Micrarchaeota archaeon]
MPLDDLFISTGVDQLIRLVKERGRLEAAAAAKELRQPLRIIEDWAHVLEEEGLIRVEYKLTKVYLVWQEPTSEYVSKRSGKLEEKAEHAKEEVERLLAKVEEGGAELKSIREQLQAISKPDELPVDAEKIGRQLEEVAEKYKTAINSGKQKLEGLQEKLRAIEKKIGKAEAMDPKRSERDMAVLRNFETTIKTQMEDAKQLAESLERQVKELRKAVEEGKEEESIAEIRSELAAIKSQKEEMISAIEALLEEQKDVSKRLAEAEKKMDSLAAEGGGLAGAKKKLAEIRRIEEDISRQKRKISDSLSDALALVKRQAAQLAQEAERQKEISSMIQQAKEEYVSIYEEISRAGEELALLEKNALGRIEERKKAIEKMRQWEKSGEAEELQKIIMVVNEISGEQKILEDKLKGLLKEAELIKMEAGSMAVASSGEEEQAQISAPASPSNFIERIKLTKEEEEEFERKRDELRSLIRKMWEESKGGSKA